MNEKTYRSGFVTIIGRPNVGKSALLNRFLGKKLSIISEKPQTTRNKILGIKNLTNCQMIFLDTPGIHSAKSKFNRYMTRVALTSLKEVDIILLVIDNEAGMDDIDKEILKRLENIDTPVLLVINKIDLLEEKSVSDIMDTYKSLYPFSDIIPASALTGENIERLLGKIEKHLPYGPKYFPDDMLTDRPERFIIAELIREKVISSTRQEIPYSIAVLVENLEIKNRLMRIESVIYVEKDSQKGIIIGRGGKMLKRIGSNAREDIEKLFGSKAYLNLWVKVRKDWRKDDKSLKEFGYN